MINHFLSLFTSFFFLPQVFSENTDAAPLGSLAPAWLPDSSVSMCQLCSFNFTMTRRRHHCRACGMVSYLGGEEGRGGDQMDRGRRASLKQSEIQLFFSLIVAHLQHVWLVGWLGSGGGGRRGGWEGRGGDKGRERCGGWRGEVGGELHL